jgi:hypothetical protein
VGIPDEAPDALRRLRRHAVDAARGLRAVLDAREGRDRRVHVNLCLNVDDVFVAGGGKIRGGRLMRLSGWVPDAEVEGVTGYAAVFADLEVKTAPVAGLEPLARLIDGAD